MTTAELAKPAQPCGTLYYVVPVRPKGSNDETEIEQCLYFDKDGQRVAPDKIDTGKGESFIRFQELIRFLPKVISDQIAAAGKEVNSTVTLFSAVAKTLDGTADLPNTYMSRGDVGSAAITLSVAPKTSRGVILIFMYPQVGAPLKLIASADPEVKNTSGN